MVRIRVLANERASRGDNVGGVDAGEEGAGLACICHEHYFVVSSLFPHLLKGVCNVVGRDFFIVLEFEEFVAAVARHVDEDV